LRDAANNGTDWQVQRTVMPRFCRAEWRSFERLMAKGLVRCHDVRVLLKWPGAAVKIGSY
jgi:hypothetical protein